MPVEVFKTSVTNEALAERVVRMIAFDFNAQANFDLTDSDRILRVVHSGQVTVSEIVNLVKGVGIAAEELQDVIQPSAHSIAKKDSVNHTFDELAIG